MIEFSLSAIFLILFFGGLFDLGFAYHRYNYMQHVVGRSTRDLLSRLQSSSGATPNCLQEMKDYFQQQSEDAMSLLGSSGKNVTWKWRFHPSHVQPDWHTVGTGSVSGDGTFTALTVRAEIPWECYFICWVIPNNFRLATNHTQLIERPGVGCGNFDFSPAPP